MAVLDAVVVGVTLLFYHKFLVVSFQPELARLRGVRVNLHQTLLLVLTALTVVLLAQVVGLVLVIALLTLPAAMASQLTGRLWVMMLLAGVLCLLFTAGGIVLSYGPELPAGATVIELTGAGYLAVIGGKWLRSRWRRGRAG
jgi:zinc transport system permease protein